MMFCRRSVCQRSFCFLFSLPTLNPTTTHPHPQHKDMFASSSRRIVGRLMAGRRPRTQVRKQNRPQIQRMPCPYTPLLPALQAWTTMAARGLASISTKGSSTAGQRQGAGPAALPPSRGQQPQLQQQVRVKDGRDDEPCEHPQRTD